MAEGGVIVTGGGGAPPTPGGKPGQLRKPSSSGTSGGGTSGGNSKKVDDNYLGTGMTEEQLKEKFQNWNNYLRDWLKKNPDITLANYKSSELGKWVLYAVKNNIKYDEAEDSVFSMEMKKKFEDLYMKSKTADARRVALKNYLEATFVGMDPKEIAKIVRESDGERIFNDWVLNKNGKYGRTPSAYSSGWNKFFADVILKSTFWKQMAPNWDKWFASMGQAERGDILGSDVTKWLNAYNTEMQKYKAAFITSTGNKELTDDLLGYAIANNIKPGTPGWDAWVKTTDLYKGSAVGEKEAYGFDALWERWFGPVPGTLADPLSATYISMKTKFLGSSDLEQETFFNRVIKNDPTFKAKYPLYDAWISAGGGGDSGEGGGAADYNLAIARWQDEYKNVLGDPNAVCPDDLIRRAIEGKWSTSTFALWVKASPDYSSSPANKEELAGRGEGFDELWSKYFGDATPPDPSLRSQYMNSKDMTSAQLQQLIQSSPAFAAAYPNWGAFAAGQLAIGVNAGDNPLLYNRYRTELYNAFAKYNMQVPAGYEDLFFRQGLSGDEVDSRLRTYTTGAESFQWFTGASPDLTEVISSKSEDLRSKIANALAVRKATSGSTNQVSYTTGQQPYTGIVTQQI